MKTRQDEFYDDWDREWDAMSHTTSEYQREIKELRARIFEYLKEIAERDHLIESMKEELALQNKYWMKSFGMDK
jgi:predicted RNase H-like nuclease (RuvC/YqgF family)